MDITFKNLHKTVENSMKTILIHSHLIDINTEHSVDFRFDRFDGSSNHLIMCFRSPAIILTADGMETAQPGDCIIHSLDFHMFHYSVPNAVEGFRNDWFYIPSKVLMPLISELQLPFNVLISTGQPEILTPYIKRLINELAINDELLERTIINQLDAMFLLIARSYRKIQIFNNEFTSSERRYFPEFVSVRNQMLKNCQQNITLKALAAEVHLSKERFAVLYRQFFKGTPYAELIIARLVLAKRLLLNSHMDVKEISAACGWEDIHYFSRLFKKKIGVSPTKYRHYSMTE